MRLGLRLTTFFAAFACAVLLLHCGATPGDSDGGTGGGGGSVMDGGADAAVEVDAGSEDAGAVSDAGGSDAGLDAGSDDAGSDDAGATDAGLDAGSDDAGTTDAGLDAAVSDAGFDAGSPDAGSLDAGELVVVVTVPNAVSYYTGIVDLAVVGDRVVTLSNPRYGTRNIATLSRFLADGRLDTTFGNNGFSVLDPGSGTVNGIGLEVDGLGRLVVGALVVSGASATSFGAARTDANGNLDTSFGSGGFATHSFGSASEICHAVAVEPDGDVLLGGSYGVAGSPGPDQWAITRFTSSGLLDTSFGNAGEVLIEIRAPGPSGVGDVDALVALPDGSFLASGRFVNFDANAGSHKGLLARFTPNGSFDSTFGTGGRVDLATIEGGAHARSLVPQSTGRLIQWVTQLGLMGFTPQGALDTTWGTGGTATLGRVPATIAVGPGDRVYALGTGPNSVTGRPAYLARLQPTGAADSAFGAKTLGLGVVGQSGDVAPSAMGFMADGRIVVGGIASPSSGPQQLFLAFFKP